MSMKKIKRNILIACTGSVATIKLPLIIEKLLNAELECQLEIKVLVSECSKHFIDFTQLPKTIDVYDESVEWKQVNVTNIREIPVVHIELGRWADLMVIAPLSANTLAKISNGLCDNLITCVVRAWDLQKPLLFCPAMNTRMYSHPITDEQIRRLKSWGYLEISSVKKTLLCGDTGIGAMAEIDTIVEQILNKLNIF